MKTLTLALLFRNDKILLAMKKRKFGEGKWNGYGGKLEAGETPLDGVVREICEESNLVVDKSSCKELGHMDFYFDDKAEWDQRVIIYRVDDFVGEPEETEEMMPKWFPITEIPYHEMWKGDDQFFPYIVEGKNFTGEIHFSETGEKLVSCVVK